METGLPHFRDLGSGHPRVPAGWRSQGCHSNRGPGPSPAMVAPWRERGATAWWWEGLRGGEGLETPPRRLEAELGNTGGTCGDPEFYPRLGGLRNPGGIRGGSSFHTRARHGPERSRTRPEVRSWPALASESRGQSPGSASVASLHPGLVAAQSPGGPRRPGAGTTPVALTSLKLGELILPQEAAGHDSGEQEEEAAGGREEPPLPHSQPLGPPASLQEQGHARPGVGWQRREARPPTSWAAAPGNPTL